MVGDLGITILSQGKEPIEADVVFVHGLGGDSHATWTKDDKLWPRDFLSQRIPHARIMTWGYDNDPIHFFKRQGHQSILSHSHDLLADVQLEREREDEKQRPVIFVGHSLGGLVIKQVRVIEHFGVSLLTEPRL
ncbi:hypothetical protein H2200_006371 [Cladophialophora chaetospira]|uniref:AB hydrolase-1 domain-containing protein n=1 Tax=Cladophialophora chaetospira TaxID=386627 RepID=A0AA38XB17_9EURO|nr:hypothetical protein H2200_006371 [Cladophialophora chaetospira]